MALQKRGARLLHVQCWLWGQDVRRAEGNLLVWHGFDRLPAPAGVTGCTQYTRQLQHGRRLRLWGFGFLYGGPTGIFVRRYEFLPRHVPVVQDAWEAESLRRHSPSQNYSALADGLREIARMEAQTQEAHGRAYRQRCMVGWKGRVPAFEALPEQWASLADCLDARA